MALKEITQDQFNEIYEQHQLWLKDELKGERANLSYTDLRKISFAGKKNLDYAILIGANLDGNNLINIKLYDASLDNCSLVETNLRGAKLIGANLSEANLREANLFGANLREANLREANLREANLERADLERANLRDTNFERANLKGANLSIIDLRKAANIPSYILEPEISPSIQEKLNRAETEKRRTEAELEKLRNNQDAKDQESTEKIKELEAELKLAIENVDQLEREKAETIQEGEHIEKGLREAFDELETANNNLEPDFERLRFLFYLFSGLIIAFFMALIILWIFAFCEYGGGTPADFKIQDLWIYASPSLILCAFIGVSIAQVNKVQTRLVALRKYSRKYDIIKIGLEGYYKVEYKLEKEPDKAQQVFEKMIEKALDEEIDTDAEEELAKRRDKKDQIPIKEALDIVVDYINKLK